MLVVKPFRAVFVARRTSQNTPKGVYYERSRSSIGIMYEYRRMSQRERDEVVRTRRLRKFPLHAPPHREGIGRYFITTACFEHRHILMADARRDELTAGVRRLLIEELCGTIHAWVVLPNHYHMLWEGDLTRLRAELPKFHGGLSFQWNGEDDARGRRVWYRFADRQIRSQAHFYASVNYIHGNPVKHGWAPTAREWKWCSFQQWEQSLGTETLRLLWRRYPIRRFGEGWDEFGCENPRS